VTSGADLKTTHLDYEGTLDCVHCGLCVPHCPTYRETGRETSSPRGRIYMMRGVAEGHIPLDAAVAREMYDCLACRACESVCPSGVRYGQLVEGMRAEVESRGVRSGAGRLLERQLLRRIVGVRPALRASMAALRFYQRSGLRRLVRGSRLLSLAPGLAASERSLGDVPDGHRPPERVEARGERRGLVAFFEGCVMPEMFATANRTTVEVLAHNGFEVAIPRGQGCCGALHLHAGDPEAAARLQQRNVAAFPADVYDAVIVNSAGCGVAMKETGDDLAPRVRDVAEFLYDVGLRPPQGRVELRVAYDDPCHLLHGQGISQQPRELLASIPGLELVELPGASECCGAAGTYSLTHADMSKRLLARKLDAIRSLEIDVVATGNPGCLMQIGAGVREAGLDIEVLHPVELLARSYSAGA